jgi:ribosomal protein L9
MVINMSANLISNATRQRHQFKPDRDEIHKCIASTWRELGKANIHIKLIKTVSANFKTDIYIINSNDS